MPQPKRNSSDWLPRLVLLVLLLTLGINQLSAYIRQMESGLQCASWPDCYGRIGDFVTPARHHAAAQLALAPDSVAKRVHRAMAAILVLLVLVIVRNSRAEARLRGRAAVLPFLILATLVLLAVNGPLSYLKTIPAIAAGNLLGGVLLAALCWRLWLQLRPAVQVAASRWLRCLAMSALLVLSIQLALGAWVSANFAGLSCNQVWRCGAAGGASTLNSAAPAFALGRELTLDAGGRVVAGGAEALIHRAHRYGAGVTSFWLLVTASLTSLWCPPLRTASSLVVALLLAQIALGAGAVHGALPLALVLLHNAFATLLLLALMRLVFALAPQPARASQ